MRALFQILIGVATAEHRREQHDHRSASTTRERAAAGRTAAAGAAPARAEPLAQQLERDRREQQASPASRSRRLASSATTRRWSAVKTNGEKCQIASFGQSSRRPPPANPQPTAKRQRDEPRRWRAAAGPTISPTMAPAYGPAMSPGEERAFERQVRGLVVQQQASATPAVSGTPSARTNVRRSGQPRRSKIRMCRKRPVSHQHGRERGHDGELDDQRREQELLRREMELRFRHLIYMILSAG